MSKPKYKVDDCIYGRTDHIGQNLPGEIVMINVDGARYESQYGHWVYVGTVYTIDKNGFEIEKIVEMREYDIIGRKK